MKRTLFCLAAVLALATPAAPAAPTSVTEIAASGNGSVTLPPNVATVNATVEILLGRLDSADFVRGLGVLLVSLAALDGLAMLAWRRGLRRYAGVGA